jgi:hypothetical protein
MSQFADLEGNINIGGQTGAQYPNLGPTGGQQQNFAPQQYIPGTLVQNTLDEPVIETIV